MKSPPARDPPNLPGLLIDQVKGTLTSSQGDVLARRFHFVNLGIERVGTSTDRLCEIGNLFFHPPFIERLCLERHPLGSAKGLSAPALAATLCVAPQPASYLSGKSSDNSARNCQFGVPVG
jgi:hypothetical protein